MMGPGPDRRTLSAMWRDGRGAVSPLLALWLIPLLGLMGLAVEASNWFAVQRAVQNVADSAAVAAAINNCVAGQACDTTAHSPTFVQEAKAVAAQGGFDDTASDVSVTAQNNVTCPATGLNTCYSVTITKTVPVFLLKAVGFTGAGQNITATALASQGATTRPYCVLAVATTGTAISNNSPNVPPAFCHMATNSSDSQATNCTKQVADIVDAVGTSDTKCVATAANAHSGKPAVSTTAYSNLASNIPADPCNNTYNDPALNAATVTWGATKRWCGPLKVSQNVVVTTPASGTVLTIYNGDLNLHPQPQTSTSLTVAAGSGLTIVFTGHKAGASHIVNMGNASTIDVAAPSSGTWAGVALYQDGSANGPTSGVDLSMSPASGGAAAWKITGLAYLPKAAVTLSGGVLKSTAGQPCFSLVAKTFSASGNYSIYSDSQTNCAGAGLSPPSSSPQGNARTGLVR